MRSEQIDLQKLVKAVFDAREIYEIGRQIQPTNLLSYQNPLVEWKKTEEPKINVEQKNPYDDMLKNLRKYTETIYKITNLGVHYFDQMRTPFSAVLAFTRREKEFFQDPFSHYDPLGHVAQHEKGHIVEVDGYSEAAAERHADQNVATGNTGGYVNK